MKNFIESVFAELDQIQERRTISDSFLHLVTEVGELGLEIQIDQGKSYKKPGDDGIIGEAFDVIICALDIIRLRNLWMSEEECTEYVLPKLRKWKKNTS